MKTTNTLHPRVPRRPSNRRQRTTKPHHIDIVWILLWVLLLIGVMLTIGVFYAVMTPAGGL